MNSTLPIENQAVCVFSAPFLDDRMAHFGILGILERPVRQPGGFPRNFGGQAGVPISAKIGFRLWRTHCGMRRVTDKCLRQGF